MERPHSTSSRGAAILSALDEDQRAAALALDGPTLIIGGAGTGKTRVLSHLIAYACAERRVSPRRLLAIAASESGAEHLRARAERLLARPLHGAWVGTFRHVCLKILAAHASALGRRPRFTILDEGDARTLIRRVARELDVDLDVNPPARLQQAIAEVKMHGGQPAGVLAALLPAYDEALARANAFDREDLLAHVTRLLADDAALRRRHRRRFEQIVVDDFQDATLPERRLLLLFAGAEGNVHVVSNPDGALAPPEEQADFARDFIGARTIWLRRGYRSTGRITYVANRLASRNPPPHAPVESVRRRGRRVVAITSGNEGEEAALAVRWIDRMFARREARDGRVAILVRQPAQFRPFEERLVGAGISYRVASGPRFYERREVRDVLAYLRLTVGGGSPRALARIANAPRRGIGPASVATIARLQRRHGIPMAEAALRAASLPRVTAERAGALADLGRLLGDLTDAARRLDAAELVDHVVERTGYGAMLTELSRAEEETRREGIDELRGMARAYTGPAIETLPHLLARVARAGGGPSGSAGKGADAPCSVQLMTYADARGTELDVVFVVGLEEGILPSRRAIRGGEAAIQAERRVCYLAMTRARDRLILLRALSRTLQGEVRVGEPSRFLVEAGRRVRRFRVGGARPPTEPTTAPAPRPELCVGQPVIHRRYGRGVVRALDETVGRRYATVRFEDQVDRRLALDFAHLEPAT